MATLNRGLRILWIVLRYPLLVLLGACEPLIGIGLTALALLMAVAAAAWASLVPFQPIPVFGLLAGAAGAVLLLGIYGLAIRVLSA
jgi:hypothetical protein